MRKSIRKTLSLCLAMAMILSVLDIPAFAEMRVVHMHEYDLVDSYDAYTYENNEQHAYTITNTYACDCNETYIELLTSYENHIKFGTGTLEYTSSNGSETIYYVSYTCKHCHSSFVVEEY